MNHKFLFNYLELAYAPLTAYEFAVIKNDLLIERALSKASLYLIAQRPSITFENITFDKSIFQLNFEIHQRGNSNVLKCILPFDQEVFGLSNCSFVKLGFNYLNISSAQEKISFQNIHGFSLIKQEKDKDEFIVWFSPEKLLQNWWKGYIECDVQGDVRSFTDYEVHYVGKATKQSILKRLTRHSTFQDILSLQSPVTERELPANEIVILAFEFKDNLQLQSFGDKAENKEIITAFLGENYPDQQKVFLDAEKALIKAMQPTYNKEMFNNYPASKDGLYNDNYNSILYTFTDPISLNYEKGSIRGGLSFLGGDSISILNNKNFRLIKHQYK